MKTTDFCPYELSKKLKECGFDEPCSGKYVDCPKDPTLFRRMGYQAWNLEKDEVIAPSLYEAQKWLREKKGIAINVIAHDRSDRYVEGKYHWSEAYLPNFKESGLQWADWFIYGKHPLFDTYEEALSDGLNQMLQLIEKGE